MNEEKLEQVCLTKWPQMLVWGQSVSAEQAQDIIFRTDCFFTDTYALSGGNNHHWNEWAWKQLGLSDIQSVAERLPEGQKWIFLEAASEHFKKLSGHVECSYVSNRWASCSYIYGPHGWVHPNGAIGYVDNIGKWPSAPEVYADWKALAAAFPFLNLTATLMSGERDEETQPVVSFRVTAGEATVLPTPAVPEIQALGHIARGGGRSFSGAAIKTPGARLERRTH